MTLTFLKKRKKSKSWLWLWLDFLTFFTIFSFFVRYFDSKKGPNSLKVCLKCKILTKWPFGTKRKRQNVFSRSPSKKVKVMTLTLLGFWKKSKSWLWLFCFFQKSQVMTWLLDDLTWLFLKKMTFGASLLLSLNSCLNVF